MFALPRGWQRDIVDERLQQVIAQRQRANQRRQPKTVKGRLSKLMKKCARASSTCAAQAPSGPRNPNTAVDVDHWAHNNK